MELDFDRHLIKGIIMTIVYLVVFVILVWIGITLLLSNVPDAGYIFENTLIYAVALGVPMAAFAGLAGYFDKGERYRLLFAEILTALTAVYFIVVLRSLNLGWTGEDYEYTLTVPGILLMIVLVLILKGSYHGVEYYIHRKKKREKAREELPVF